MGSGSSILVWNDPWFNRTRPANKNQQNLYPDLIMVSFINATTKTWNLQAIQSFVDSHDAKIIENIPLSMQLADRVGSHFTDNEKYTVKSRYQVERVYLDRKMSSTVWIHYRSAKGVLLKIWWNKTFCMESSDMMHMGQEEPTNKRNPRGYTLW